MYYYGVIEFKKFVSSVFSDTKVHFNFNPMLHAVKCFNGIFKTNLITKALNQ